jgi:hypothetical protein
MCEIGAGSGYLSWALIKAGFEDLTILEPNTHYVTGTGYLTSRPDAQTINCFSSEQCWYEDGRIYDNILTHNCIHHFRGIGYVAACIRTKMRPNARWFALREWYADTAAETYERLLAHPYALKYGVYEFPYSSLQMTQAIEAAGFRLEGVLPAGYRDDVLAQYVPVLEHHRARDLALDLLLSRRPGVLADLYRLEHILNACTPAHLALFTRPQLMVFRRVEVPAADLVTGSRRQ